MMVSYVFIYIYIYIYINIDIDNYLYIHTYIIYQRFAAEKWIPGNVTLPKEVSPLPSLSIHADAEFVLDP
jgi:hypothetical protein